MPQTYYLAGPTAVGKSALAVAVAELLGAEIIGCDAFQVYAELPILTAQPEPELKARVPHHLIGSISVSEEYDAAKYVADAETAIQAVHDRGRHALVVGGAGMYLRALTRGFSDLPAVDSALREELNQLSLEEICRRLGELDPQGLGAIDRNNPRRVTRALEICLLTGQPFSSLRNEWSTPPSDVRGVLLIRTRGELLDRISLRTREMFRAGVVEEVRRCPPAGETASKTLGFQTIQEVIHGRLPVTTAIEQIQIATRQYAKRQMTWFRREEWLTEVPMDANTSRDELIQTVVRLLSGTS